MAKPKWQGLKTMRSLFLVVFILVALLPEEAWANLSYPPGMTVIPPALIILLPLVMLFTELGGGYKILQAETSGGFKTLNQWKPVLAIVAIISPAFIPLYAGPTVIILLVVFVFAIGRGLALIHYGFNAKSEEICIKRFKNSDLWRSKIRPTRLMASGITIVFLTVILAAAVFEAGVSPNPYRHRAHDSDTKANLHNIFLACKAYWADNGSANACNADFYNSTTYGYIQSRNVLVAGKGGNEQSFNIIAMNQNSKKAFEVDNLGTISQYFGPLNEEMVAELPEEPGMLSKAWKALVGVFRW